MPHDGRKLLRASERKLAVVPPPALLLESEGALDAIRKGRRGVHVIAPDGTVAEAFALIDYGKGEYLVTTRYLNGDPGPLYLASRLRVLARTYEQEES